MGGVGKTELATQYANQYKDNYGGIAWFNDRETNLAAEVLKFFVKWGLEIPQELGGRLLSLKEQVAWCWSQYPDSPLPILIVFDDVTKLANLREVVPTDNRFRVLVTTRSRHLDPNLIQEIPLDVLSPQKEPGKALELLKGLLGNTDRRVDSQPAAATAICECLEYLPLGIELVGGYLVRDPDISLNTMFGRLQERKLAESALQDQETLNSTQLGVKAAFALTWLELDPLAQQLGRFLSLFAPQLILWDLVIRVATESPFPQQTETKAQVQLANDNQSVPANFVSCAPEKQSADNLLTWSLDELNSAKKQLYGRNLLQRVEDSEGYYKIHALVHWFLQMQLAESGEMKSVLERTFATAMITIAQNLPELPTTFRDIELLKDVNPHFEDLGKRLIAEIRETREGQTISSASVNNDQVIWVFVAVSKFYFGQGLYNSAEPWSKECVRVCKTLVSGDHPNLATSLNDLAFLYYTQGRYDQAEPLFIEALEMRKRIFAGDHPDVADSLNKLGGLYHTQGRFDQVEPLFIEALEMRKRIFAGDHRAVVTSLKNLALLYTSQGRFDQAKPLLVEALEMTKRVFVGDHPAVVTSLKNLALLYDSQGRYDQAEPLFVEALEITKRVFVGDHPDVANSLNCLAGLYDKQGRYDQAEPLFVEALEMRKRVFVGDHPDVADSLDCLAGLYSYQGRYDQAEPLFVEAIEMRKRVFVGDHPNLAMNLNNLASLYHIQQRYDQAEPLLVEALEMRKRVFVGDHPLVSCSLNVLAGLYDKQGRYDQAEPLFVEALEMIKRAFVGDHPAVVTSLNSLAEFYNRQGRYSQAEPLFVEALEMTKRMFVGDHLYVADSLRSLAELYSGQGRYDQAEPLFVEALEMIKRVFVGDHHNLAHTLNSLAKLYDRQGRYDQAEPLFVEALEITKRVFVSNHPLVSCSLNVLALFYSKQGRYDQAEPLFVEALEIRQRVLGINHPSTADVREQLIILQRKRTAPPIWIRWLGQFVKILLAVLILPLQLLWLLVKQMLTFLFRV